MKIAIVIANLLKLALLWWLIIELVRFNLRLG
jgi:hypothetical protein